MTDFWRGPKIGAFPSHMEGNGRGWYHSIRMETCENCRPSGDSMGQTEERSYSRIRHTSEVRLTLAGILQSKRKRGRKYPSFLRDPVFRLKISSD